MNTGFAKSTGNKIGAFLEALLLFLIAVAGQTSIAVAQSTGTFSATGSMTIPGLDTRPPCSPTARS